MEEQPPPIPPAPPPAPPPAFAQGPPPGWKKQSPPPGAELSSLWTPSTAVYGTLAGLGGALVLLVMFATIYMLFGGKEDDSAMTVAAAVIQDATFVAAAWFFASRLGQPRLRDFGLRRVAFKRALAIAVALGTAYAVLLAVYSSLVTLKEDTVPQDLGADKSTLAMVAFALIAIVMAPLVEEFFFRGFIFRALANRAGIVLGALGSSLFFGMLHWDFSTTDRLLAVVPLTIFGLILVLAYHFSGSLYTAIAMHATNNSLAVVAFAAKEGSDAGIVLGAVLWLAMMAVCVIGPRFTDPPGGPNASSSIPPPQWAPQQTSLEMRQGTSQENFPGYAAPPGP